MNLKSLGLAGIAVAVFARQAKVQQEEVELVFIVSGVRRCCLAYLCGA